MSLHRLTAEDRRRLRRMYEGLPVGHWKSMVEGRDHVGGDSFILVEASGSRGADIYVSLDAKPAPPETLDFIAEAHNTMPLLLDEIERLSGLTPDTDLAE